MSGGQLDVAAIARSLDEDEREALLRLDDDAWLTSPSLEITTTLLFGHGIPLIAVNGDWAKRTRTGAAVCRELAGAAS